MNTLHFIILLAATPAVVFGLAKPRARDLGIPFDGVTGPLNAITDVAGVKVGHSTLIEGEGPLVTGQGPIRTGVTAILPRGMHRYDRVFAATHAFNGNGEMTGTAWIRESGHLEGPIVMTNTHSVGTAMEAVVRWSLREAPGDDPVSLPVVVETWDGRLNDINGFHIRAEHVWSALNEATGGPVAEGNVGGGTGMRAFDFKAGIGTSSRLVNTDAGPFVIGVLVQANFARRQHLVIAGIPVGREITDRRPIIRQGPSRDGSLAAVVATDAPLLPHQLERLAKRVSLGMARTGTPSMNSSGDLFIAFSTFVPEQIGDGPLFGTKFIDTNAMDPLLEATIHATEEAIINALVAAETMSGIDGNTYFALPHQRVREILAAHDRIEAVQFALPEQP
jgi:L-aminopeptidase/D-esterase-like protein